MPPQLRDFSPSPDAITTTPRLPDGCVRNLLGYMSDDPDYRALDKQISDLESAINGKRDVSTMFSQLRDKVAAFLKRQRDRERH